MSLALTSWNTAHTQNGEYVLPEAPTIDPVGTPGTPSILRNMTVIENQNTFVRSGLQQGFIGTATQVERVGDWLGQNKTLVYGAVGAIVLLSLLSGRGR